MWERVVLCAIYYFPDPVGGGNSLPTQGSNRKWKGFTGTSKRKPKGTTRNTNSNHQEIKWFQQEITRHQQEIHSHEWTQKGIHRKSKGWMACAINSERTPILLPTGAQKSPCAIYFLVAPFPKITTHEKPCAIYPPLKWGQKRVPRYHLLALPFFPSCATHFFVRCTFANLIANLSRMVLTTSERLFYRKLLTRGF